MIYGYARVSSIGQATDGNSLEAQEKELRARGCDVVYSEAFTGTTTHRPEFSKILSKLQKGDTLMVTKLDRFSRTLAEGVNLIQELHAKGVIIDILNMGRADNTSTGNLMIAMLLAFAEFERTQIIERLSTGKAIAKAHGKKTDGRYKKEPSDFRKFVIMQRNGEITVSEACEKMGIGRTTWYKRLTELE